MKSLDSVILIVHLNSTLPMINYINDYQLVGRELL